MSFKNISIHICKMCDKESIESADIVTLNEKVINIEDGKNEIKQKEYGENDNSLESVNIKSSKVN